MKLTEIDIHSITAPDWNPNQIDSETRDRLRASIRKFGLVAPLVVREISPHKYETVGGAQRLSVIQELGFETVDCVVVETSDAESRLLAQALNRISGTDDPVKRQASLDLILKKIPKGTVLELLPEAANSFGQATSFKPPTLIEHFQSYEISRRARLNHISAQLIDEQLPIVEQAIAHASDNGATDKANPNKRGNAFFHICQIYLSTVEAPIGAPIGVSREF